MKTPTTDIIAYPVALAADSRLAQVLAAVDNANQADPRLETLDGRELPKELAYSIRMSRWLFRLQEQPSELAQIACRAQHIERWTIARNDYPDGRAGYYQWRRACGRYHGERAARLMAENAYPANDCDAIKAIISKHDIHNNADTQLMEDAACLVFLERYLEPFYRQHSDYDMKKWTRIISRTWGKMSGEAQQLALAMLSSLPDDLQKLLKQTLSA